MLKETISPEQLQSLCETGAFREISSILSQSKSAELRALAPIAIKTAKKFVGSFEATNEQKTACVLSLIYTLTESEWSKVRLWPFDISDEFRDAELLRPLESEKVRSFADRILRLSPRNFAAVQAYIKAGLITKPRGNDYVAGLICEMSWPNKNRVGLKALLRERDEFFSDDLWMLFEFDGAADHCLASADKFLTNAAESWHSVIIDFTNEGLIDRQRVLDSSLAALSLGFNQFRAGWFTRFHEGLEATIDERATRVLVYLQLLRNEVPRTVTFAIESLLVLAKQKKLAFVSAEPYLDRALASSTKATALTALKVLEACAKSDPTCGNAAAKLACEAFFGQIADVQTKALSFISQFGNLADPQLRERFARNESALVASVRSKIPRQLAESNSESSSAAMPDSTSAAGRCLHNPGDAGIAPTSGKMEFSKSESKVTEAIELTPIVNLDDLIYKASHVLENPANPGDYELVIDGISRMCTERPADFKSRTSAILKRATQLHERTEDTMVRLLSKLVIAWISGTAADESGFANRWMGRTTFSEMHATRINPIVDRALAGIAAPLLSAPSRYYGWLTMELLAERLEQWRPIGWERIDQTDLTVALLRIPQTSEPARERPAVLAEYFEYVSKQKTDKNLILSDLLSGEQLTVPATNTNFAWSISHEERSSFRFAYVNVNPNPMDYFPGMLHREITALLSHRDGWWTPASVIGTSPTLHLLNGWVAPTLETHFAWTAYWLGRALNYATQVDDKLVKYAFECFFDPRRNFGEMAHLSLVLGISMGDQDICGAVRDAFVELVATERLNADLIAEIMHKLFHDGATIKCGRWSKNLQDIARASDEHARVVFCILESVLSNSSIAPPKDIHYLLELFLELKAQLQRSLTPGCFEYLSSIGTGGKTKTLIRELCR